ncbi:MAG: 3-oxoacyl-[acyl-carrier-protein] reductase [Peptostreptococcaceae bacterium]|nr:3-oxoacyl-[acyl-carrier-protein] reductase [Peptostreptococcaceae bacterium]
MGCIIVTGASKGIGRAIAVELAKAGKDIVLVYQNPANDVSPIIAEIGSHGAKAIGLAVNVADHDSTKKMTEEAVAAFGTIDGLVNNAGITKDRLLLRMNEQDFSDVIDVNLKGTFNCTKNVARQMMKQKYGSIVNLSSVVSLSGNIGQANYSASKGAVNAFTKTAAKELAMYNIRVNAVAPGMIKTQMTDVIPEEAREKMLASIPLGRIGEPQDVADLVSFLISDRSSYITGQVISVNGGMY